MYLGTLLFCLGFFLAIPSILAFMIWIAFFLVYNKMATYEENDLIRILGEDMPLTKNECQNGFPDYFGKAEGDLINFGH